MSIIFYVFLLVFAAFYIGLVIGYKQGKDIGTAQGWNEAYDANGRHLWPGHIWKGWTFKKDTVRR